MVPGLASGSKIKIFIKIVLFEKEVIMTITDVMFLFFFLPFALVVYYLGKESYRKYILLVLSLVFYACGAPEYVLLLLLSLVINILAGKLIARPWKGKLWRGLILLAGIGYNVLVLLYYKYFDFI